MDRVGPLAMSFREQTRMLEARGVRGRKAPEAVQNRQLVDFVKIYV
jgi:hypothetical protein